MNHLPSAKAKEPRPGGEEGQAGDDAGGDAGGEAMGEDNRKSCTEEAQALPGRRGPDGPQHASPGRLAQAGSSDENGGDAARERSGGATTTNAERVSSPGPNASGPCAQ